jgi:DUF4097 and DUF4098 domain-containing protein YvlB
LHHNAILLKKENTMSRHVAPAPPAILRTSRVPALLGSLLICAAGTAMAEEKVVDRRFTVTPGGLLTVNADGARISVEGGDSTQVVVHMDVSGSQADLDDMKMSASQGEGGVTVEMRSQRVNWPNWGSRRKQASIEVTVPRNYRLEIRTTGGDIRLESIAGPSRVRTSGGNIVARDLKGDLDGETSGGDVRLESLEGAVKVHTSGGDIHAAGVRGDIKADTSGGDVRLFGIDGRIRANTSGGNVQCELVGANRGISASTSGGGVRLKLPRGTTGTLDAESSGGKINTDFTIATRHWEPHRLYGEINGGGEAIRVRTSGGGITLNAVE